MRAVVVAIALVAVAGEGCGDQTIPPTPEAGLDIDAVGDGPAGTLFGEACTQPPAPEIGVCHDGEGACHDEPGGAVCRPFCHFAGTSQCADLGGVEAVTDRGACVCVPST